MVPPEASRLYQPESFYTWHRRPRSMDSLEAPQTDGSNAFALVVQGPFVRQHSFTLHSLKFYRRLLPESRIILSTWKGLDFNEKRHLDSLAVELVENRPPEVPGLGNLNFQIRSTAAGLERLNGSQVKFVVKLRTDQRIYNPNAFAIMRELLEVYPRQDNSFRIGAASLNSFLTRPFSLSDMLQFSSLASLSQFWSIGEVSWDLGELTPEAQGFPEALLVITFLQGRGWTIGDPDETWRRAIAKEFLIADSNSLDHFWQKYSKREHLWRRYGTHDAPRELDFGTWLTLKANEGH